MNGTEERIKTETEEAAEEAAKAGQEPEEDPFVGVQEDLEEPWMEPIEEAEKYVYQKGDFWAFLIAAVRVFLPILLLFVGGILLVYWFFAR
ncbi:MAG: hypothetical protein J5865_06440 [Lachnospiraceae bacterium]|nr:hypothetical protein [Lachnospiraceae bacterium]